MTRLRWLALLIILTALLLTMEVAEAADLQISWDRVTTDVNGDFISAEMQYKIYAMMAGQTEFKSYVQTPDTMFIVPLTQYGCFSVYITAIRMDSLTESVPSNGVDVCYYAVDAPAQDIPQVDPEPEPVQIPLLPPAATTLEMRIDG